MCPSLDIAKIFVVRQHFPFQLIVILRMSFVSDCINFKEVMFLFIINELKLDHSVLIHTTI